MRIAVAGLGRLGLPFALCLAEAGHEVVGVDNCPAVVSAINARAVKTVEPGVVESLARQRTNLRATTSLADAVNASAATFIVVPTPSLASGAFSPDHVVDVLRGIARELTIGARNHLVVVTSTLSPGSMDQIRWVLEGDRRGEDGGLELCYSPAFAALGSAMKDITTPDLVVIGERDARAGRLLEDIYQPLHKNHPPTFRMTFANAEIAKLAVNAFVTMKISFANMLTALCEQHSGGDIDVVTAALAVDHRIGKGALRGGLAFGGPCFPRDNRALAHALISAGVGAELPLATDQVNVSQRQRLMQKVLQLCPAGGTVAILGIAYKAGTEVTDHAAGFHLLQDLENCGVRVKAYDPNIGPAGVEPQYAAMLCSSLAEALVNADVVVIATAWNGFRSVADQISAGKRPRLIDCWRLLDRPEDSSSSDAGRGAGVLTENVSADTDIRCGE